MHFNYKTSFPLVLFLTAITIALTGCQSLGFKQPVFKAPTIPSPDLGKLAFWKKGEPDRLPPPPARVFDPAPINGDAASQFASRDANGSGGRFDNRGDQALDEINASLTGSDAPIRTPYSNDLAASPSSKENQFEFNTGNVRSKLAELENEANRGLTPGQQDFQDAMNHVGDQVDSSSTAFQDNASEMASGFSNSFESSMPETTGSTNSLNSDVRSGLAKMAEPFTGIPQSSGFSSQPQNTMPAGGASEELMTAQAQIAEAKRQIEALKRQVAMADGSAVSPWSEPAAGGTPGAGANFNPLAPLPVVRSQKSKAPIDGMVANPYFTPDRVATHDRGAGGTGMNPNFGPSEMPKASQVDFQSIEGNQRLNAYGDAIPPASRIPNYVSDVDIPEAILQGKGSYSPGSVNRLK